MLSHYIYYLYLRLTTRLFSTRCSFAINNLLVAINNLFVCYQQHARLQSTKYSFAINNIHVCYQQHPHLRSTIYVFAINNIIVCYQQNTRLLSSTYLFAINNLHFVLGAVDKHIVLMFTIVPL